MMCGPPPGGGGGGGPVILGGPLVHGAPSGAGEIGPRPCRPKWRFLPVRPAGLPGDHGGGVGHRAAGGAAGCSTGPVSLKPGRGRTADDGGRLRGGSGRRPGGGGDHPRSGGGPGGGRPSGGGPVGSPTPRPFS